MLNSWFGAAKIIVPSLNLRFVSLIKSLELKTALII
jgi:hypothetical protein